MKHKTTMVREDIIQKVNRCKKGTLFFLTSFPGMDEEWVRKVLAMLVDDGTLVRIANGVFLKPERSRFGIVYPQPGEVVKAIAKRDHAEVLPNGFVALNELGLSTQVPVKYMYLTSGATRVVKLGETEVELRHASPRNFAFRDPFMGTLYQALKCHGEEGYTDEERMQIARLIRTFAKGETMEHDLQLMSGWMKKLIKESTRNFNAALPRL